MSIAFTSPAFLWFLLCLVPLALLYIYFARRQSRIVPSLNIWSSVRSAHSKRLSPPLKRFLEWFFASLFICTSVLSAAGIHIGASSTEQKHLVFLLDNSSSMTRAMNPSPERTLLERSTSKLQTFLQTIPKKTNWTIVRLAPVPQVLKNGEGPPETSELSTPSAPLIASTSRLNRFLSSLTSRVSSTSHSTQLYLLSDQQIPSLPRLFKEHKHLTLMSLGGPESNVSITNASIRRKQGKPDELTLTLHNFSPDERTFPVRLHGLVNRNVQVSLSAGEKKQLRRPLPPASNNPNNVGAFIDTNDAFPLDNGAYLLRHDPESVFVDLQLSSDASTFVRSVIQAIGSPYAIHQSNRQSQNGTSSGTKRNSSILVTDASPNESADRYTTGTIAFHPMDSASKIKPSEDKLNIYRTSSPLTKGLSFEELTLNQYTPISPNQNETCLMRIDNRCVAVRGTPPDSPPYVHFGFALSKSNFVGLPEFPLLLKRIFTFFTTQASLLNQSTPPKHSKNNPQKQWIRTHLKPNGSIQTTSVQTSPHTQFSIQPGWYAQKSNDGIGQDTTVNFFYPSESNIHRSHPDNQLRTISLSNLQTINSQPYDLQAIMLLLSGLFWIAFLFLTYI